MRTYLLLCFSFCLELSGCTAWELADKHWTDTSAGNVPELVYVSSGAFQMGSNDGEANEQPVHPVSLNRSFYIGKFEVTVKQYRAFCSATKRSFPVNPYWDWQDDHPITVVSLDDALAYCVWLSGQTGKPFRLPTEAEWEYAAKGGGTPNQTFTYVGSNNADEVGWYGVTDYVNKLGGTPGTHPVGKKKPNQLGIYDMSGNVWEWCSDWFGTYPSVLVTNPTGPSSGAYRMFRGGSWADYAAHLRPTQRWGTITTVPYYNVGFRVVQDIN